MRIVIFICIVNYYLVVLLNRECTAEKQNFAHKMDDLLTEFYTCKYIALLSASLNILKNKCLY